MRRQSAFSIISKDESDRKAFKEAAAESSRLWSQAYLLNIGAVLNETNFGKDILPDADPEMLLAYVKDLRVAAGHLCAQPAKVWNNTALEQISEGCKLNAKADILRFRAVELMEESE